MQTGDEVSLDTLFEEQMKNASTLFATVEPVTGKPELVKVTPWIPGRGCACRFSLVIERKSIKKLVRTKHRHRCCGQVLSVVEVELDEHSVMPLGDVLADLTRRASRESSPKRRTRARATRTYGGRWGIRSLRSTVLPVMIGDGPPSGWSGGDGGEEGDGDDDGDDGDSGEYASYQEYSNCMDTCYDDCMAVEQGNGKPNYITIQQCLNECNDKCRGLG